MNTILRALPYIAAFAAGVVVTSLYTRTNIDTKPQLERVSIMRPVAHEAIPAPLTTLTEISATQSTDHSITSHSAADTAQKDTTDTLSTSAHESSVQNQDTGIVEFVYDGDTVRLADKRKVRLIGIDTPEMNYGKGEPECYAREAKKQLEALILNKEITLVPDAEDKDRYGRSLRYVYTTTPEGSVFVNNALVQHGAGLAKRYPPNTTQAEILESSMQKAQSSKVGLWNVCK